MSSTEDKNEWPGLRKMRHLWFTRHRGGSHWKCCNCSCQCIRPCQHTSACSLHFVWGFQQESDRVRRCVFCVLSRCNIRRWDHHFPVLHQLCVKFINWGVFPGVENDKGEKVDPFHGCCERDRQKYPHSFYVIILFQWKIIPNYYYGANTA